MAGTACGRRRHLRRAGKQGAQLHQDYGCSPQRLQQVERTRLTGPSGATSISGGDLRSSLGLRSTWFTIGVLRLNGGGSIERGEAARLRALARNLGDVNLQRRRAGSGSLVNVRRISGRVTVSVRPRVTSFYRLRSQAAATASVRVVVGPAPRLVASERVASLAGAG